MTDRPRAFVSARLIDPVSDYDGPGGVFVERGRIADSGPLVVDEAFGPDVEIIDCAERALCPGLIDLRAEIGEPGREAIETLGELADQAAASGITTIVAQPNTQPILDEPALIAYLAQRGETLPVNLRVSAAASKGLAAKELSEIALLQDAGASLFSSGDRWIRNSQFMRRLLAYASAQNATIAAYAEDVDLVGDACATESEFATRLGLRAAPALAESMALTRDLSLVRLTGARYHAELVSTGASAEAIERAKDAGDAVTAAASIAHLTFNELDIGEFDANCRFQPPLRIEEDRKAVIEAIADGAIDAIVSNHKPVTADEKNAPFEDAAPDASTLAAFLPAALSLYHERAVGLLRLIDALTRAPADIIGSPAGRLTKGAPADLVLIDLEKPVLPQAQATKPSPFEGRRLQGQAILTVVQGEIVFEASH